MKKIVTLALILATTLAANATQKTLTGVKSFLSLNDTPSSYTNGSVLFSTTNSVDQDATNLFYDDVNKRLGIGTNAPTKDLEIIKASGLDGATPVTMQLYSSDSGTWTDEAIMAQLLFGSADTGGGAGSKVGIKAYIDDTSGSDVGMSLWTTTGGSGSFSEKMRIGHDGRVAIGTTQTETASTVHRFSVIGTGIQFYSSDVITDDTAKQFRIGMPVYDNGTYDRPFIGWYMAANSGENQVNFGGGTSAGYAATTLRFVTAADAQTTTGTTRGTVTSDGAFLWGTSTNSGLVTIGASRSYAGWTSSVTGKTISVSSATITDTDQSGTITNRVSNSIAIPTFASTNSVTVTNAANVYIAGAAAAGTNTTITNPYALWIDAGVTRLDGSVLIGSSGTPHTGLQTATAVAFPYVAKTGAYTATSSDYTINCTSGTFTVTLPTAVGIAGRIYVVKNSGAGTITVDADGSETIDGAATYSMPTQYQSITLQSNGANWILF